MSRGVSASTVKAWFQYRCERKVRYEISDDVELKEAPVIRDVREQSWAILGQDFEERVVGALDGVLRPAPGDRFLSERLTTAFLRGQRPEAFVAQANLMPARPPAMLRAAGVPLRRSFPDLIQRRVEDGVAVLTIIDVKATRRATPFHKTQVAFYARVLEQMLEDLAAAGQVRIDPFGEIWRIPDNGTAEGDRAQVERFGLKPYLRLVDDFCADQLPRIAGKRIGGGADETFFHLYFKCEQCDFLEHCIKSIDPARPAARRDVSAVAGLSHEAKRSLERLGVDSVAGLAAAQGLAAAPGVGWSLSRRAPLLNVRAQALAENRVMRTQEEQTFLMPGRADTVLLLSVDHDPVDDRLAAIGYRRIEDGVVAGGHVEVPATGASRDEAEAMVSVLGRLIDDLAAIDAANAAAGPEQGRMAHIFLYEPAEAMNLQRAVGRHLDDPRVRGGLLNLVRLFPPEEVVPEPEFRGMHHLPATAVRSVVETLFALPAAVSYDLRQVSAAIAASGAAVVPYVPAPAFARPFSSLLSIDVIRAMREGKAGAAGPAEIVADVEARLDALQGLIAWLFAENAAAAAGGQPILRLAKKPFRFQASFDPLNIDDLDVLTACELLESRAGLLESLVGLAQPATRRRDTGRCLAGLTLVKDWKHGRDRVLQFKVPDASRDTDLDAGAFGLILTDDSPDLRLDPSQWPAVGCRIRPPGAGFEDRRDLVQVSMPEAQYQSQTIQDLKRDTGPGGWHIDQGFSDINAAKATAFLRGLGGPT